MSIFSLLKYTSISSLMSAYPALNKIILLSSSSIFISTIASMTFLFWKSILSLILLLNESSFNKFFSILLLFFKSSFILLKRIFTCFNLVLKLLTEDILIIFSIMLLISIIESLMLLLDEIISSIFSVSNFIFSPQLGQINCTFPLLITIILISLFAIPF